MRAGASSTEDDIFTWTDRARNSYALNGHAVRALITPRAAMARWWRASCQRAGFN